ncbi:MAG TPA: SRPBCC family protein [Tahibacter sp.]|uniref:SRPBCC family protein n=1 Tax=Tahibacter sp. TaxID=2056211 RepID=UPI002CAD5945|nr:SRPBCC family protein [Tahibacter sp.]HSX59359.1 SRPBCC family protein [Tahibacter sp.]
MLKIILLVVLVAIAALLVAAAFRPDSFRIERSITIKAAPEKVFALIDDFHRWTAWSPWEKLDPAMKREHSGSASGKDAVYAWEGNGKVGKGSMQIVESVPHSKVLIQLHFIKPMDTRSHAEFTLRPGGDTTEVNWAMYGPQPYMSKLMGLVFNMDKMIGKDFEKGLADLKSAAES